MATYSMLYWSSMQGAVLGLKIVQVKDVKHNSSQHNKKHTPIVATHSHSKKGMIGVPKWAYVTFSELPLDPQARLAALQRWQTLLPLIGRSPYVHHDKSLPFRAT